MVLSVPRVGHGVIRRAWIVGFMVGSIMAAGVSVGAESTVGVTGGAVGVSVGLSSALMLDCSTEQDDVKRLIKIARARTGTLIGRREPLIVSFPSRCVTARVLHGCDDDH